METWIESETLYEGKIVTLKRGRVRLENGQEADRRVVDPHGAVVSAPKPGDIGGSGRQYRGARGTDPERQGSISPGGVGWQGVVVAVILQAAWGSGPSIYQRDGWRLDLH